MKNFGYRLLTGSFLAVALNACDDLHVVDHRCPVSYGDPADWVDRELNVVHDEPRSCPVRIAAGGPSTIYFSATGVQRNGAGDPAERIDGTVRDRIGFAVSQPMGEDFFYYPLSNDFRATANGSYLAARGEATPGATGSDYAYLDVLTRQLVLTATVSLKYKYGVGNALIVGESHVNGSGNCVYTADVPFEPTPVQWTWYLNDQPAPEGGGGSTWTAMWDRLGQNKLQARGIDGDQFERWAEFWVEVDDGGVSCPSY